MAGETLNYLIQLLYDKRTGKLVVRDFKKIDKEAGKVGKQLDKGKKKMGDFQKAMRRVAIVLPVWAAMRAIIKGIQQVLSSSIKFLVDWEKQMARVRIVGATTNEQFEQMSKGLLEVAAAYGIANELIGQGAILWRQQGKSISELIPLMDTTIRLSLLTGRTVGESVEDLTAIMKNFRIEASESNQIVDKLTKVMLNHAITMDVLVAAIKDTAAVADQFGITFEKLLGIITAMEVATRAQGQRIGKALRTIFSRMATTAQNAIQTIAKVPLFLDETGKATFRNTGILREFGEVLDEIAIAFSGLTKQQQAQLGYAIAGRRRLTLLTSAFQQWEEGVKASIEALDSFGEGQRAVNIILETTNQKQKRLTATWNQFVDSLAGVEGLRGFFDFLISQIEDFIWMSASFKGEEFYKFYLESKIAAKTFKNITNSLDEQISKQKTLGDLSSDLIGLLKIRQRLERRPTKEAARRVKELDKQITLITDALQKDISFKELVSLPYDEMLNELKKKQPEFEDAILSLQAQRNIEARNKELKDEILAIWRRYIADVKKFRPPSVPAQLMRDIKDISVFESSVEEIKKLMDDLIKYTSKAEFHWLSKEDIRLVKEMWLVLRTVVEKRKELTALSKKNIEAERERVKIHKQVKNELDKIATADKTRQEEAITRIKFLTKLGFSQLDVNKKLIAFYEKEAEAGREVNLEAIRRLKLETELLEKQKKQIIIPNLMIDRQLELLRIRGASERQLIEMEGLLKNAYGIVQDEVDILKKQHKLEQAITEEKQNQNNLSSDTVKLVKVAQKFGISAAQEISKLLAGEISFEGLTRGAKQALRLAFPSEFEQARAARYLERTPGLVTPERRVEAEVEEAKLKAFEENIEKLNEAFIKLNRRAAQTKDELRLFAEGKFPGQTGVPLESYVGERKFLKEQIVKPQVSADVEVTLNVQPGEKQLTDKVSQEVDKKLKNTGLDKIINDYYGKQG